MKPIPANLFQSVPDLFALRVGDLYCRFHTRETRRGGVSNWIDEGSWLREAAHRTATPASAVLVLEHLANLYRSEFPNLRTDIDEKVGMGGIFLYFPGGRIIILGFDTVPLSEHGFEGLQQRAAEVKKANAEGFGA